MLFLSFNLQTQVQFIISYFIWNMFHCHCANLLKLECSSEAQENCSYQNQFVLLQKPFLLHSQKHVFSSSCSQGHNKGYKESNGIPFLLCLEKLTTSSTWSLYQIPPVVIPHVRMRQGVKQSVMFVSQFVSPVKNFET